MKNAAEKDSSSSGADSTCVLRRAHSKLPLNRLYAEKSFFPKGGLAAWPGQCPPGSGAPVCTAALLLRRALRGRAWAEQLSGRQWVLILSIFCKS